jgi:LmbE family N-acetylglucosaminyl deacetylase
VTLRIAVLARVAMAVRPGEGESVEHIVSRATWPVGLAQRLVKEVQARGLGAGLWGLEPAAFGAQEKAITTVLDVSAFLYAKLAAVRAHRSQLSSDHLLVQHPRRPGRGAAGPRVLRLPGFARVVE